MTLSKGSFRVAISGATGMVGRALSTHLETKGHSCLGLSRQTGAGLCYWNPEQQIIESEKLVDTDVFINLAGEPISQRWSDATKRRILSSRLDSTRLLVDTFLQKGLKPKAFLSASAIGYYGAVRKGAVDEGASYGEGFLADVCRQWEAVTEPLSKAGIRVVNMRIGVVLDASGGALTKILPIFKTGMGGPIGNGKQQMSWIGLTDLCRCFEFCMNKEHIVGPVNAVAPRSVSNAEFAKALGAALSRPACIPTPALALKGMYGQMANETILSDVSVKPKRLIDAGFAFQQEELGQWMLRG